MNGTEEPAGILRPAQPEPLWSRVVEQLATAIADKRFAIGSRLPPERELCVQLDVSRVTLRRALQHLVETGTLVSHQGRGWFVASEHQEGWSSNLESFTETANRMHLTASSHVIAAETVLAAIDDAERLLIAPGTQLFRLRRVRLLDGVPTAVDTALVPVSVAPGLLDVDFRSASLYASLEARGIRLQGADTVLEARPADDETGAALAIPATAPVLAIRQLVFDEPGRAVLLSTVVYAGERYRLRTSFSRSAT